MSKMKYLSSSSSGVVSKFPSCSQSPNLVRRISLFFLAVFVIPRNSGLIRADIPPLWPIKIPRGWKLVAYVDSGFPAPSESQEKEAFNDCVTHCNFSAQREDTKSHLNLTTLTPSVGLQAYLDAISKCHIASPKKNNQH